MATEPNIIILWTHPRAMSTVFERSILERDDCIVFHEPFSYPYYFGPPGTRISTRYGLEDTREELTYSCIIDSILQGRTDLDFVRDRARERGEGKEEERPTVFVKLMTYCVIDSEGSFLMDEASVAKLQELMLSPRVKHAFLVRTPFKSIPSLHRLTIGRDLQNEAEESVGWDHFEEEEVGIREMNMLHQWLLQRHPDMDGKEPEEAKLLFPIVHAEDLKYQPRAVLERFCSGVGLPFTESMLVWEDREIEEWATWKVYSFLFSFFSLFILLFSGLA